MKKEILLATYHMTHDYGVNPCCFTKDDKPTPDLLTIGWCAKDIRLCMNKVFNPNKEKFDFYIAAIAGNTGDNGREFTKDGKRLITEDYESLIYIAKISEVITRIEYLHNPDYTQRKDVNICKLADGEEKDPVVLLSNNFIYYGKQAKKKELLSKDFKSLFRHGQSSRPPLYSTSVNLKGVMTGWNGRQHNEPPKPNLREIIMEEFAVGRENIVNEPYCPNPKFD